MKHLEYVQKRAKTHTAYTIIFLCLSKTVNDLTVSFN